MTIPNSICVYCASSNRVPEVHFEAAREVGKRLAEAGAALVYGGGRTGLMGAVALATHAHGGKVIGVIPHRLKTVEVAYTEADELITTDSMRERKAVMEARADAFLILAGGFGTLDEAMECLTQKILGFHDKPIVFLNTDGFYDDFFRFCDKLVAEHFSKPETRSLYFVAATVDDVFQHLAAQA